MHPPLPPSTTRLPRHGLPLLKSRPSVRSYVIREGRFTKGQQAAFEHHWPHYGIEPGQGPLDLGALFGNLRPVVLDIGFGDGEALALLGCRYPHLNFLGVEVYRPGIGSLLRRIDESELGNVRVVNMDAVRVLREYLAPESLAAVLIWFPDPWPKKRHHKRRLVQAEFVQLVAERLASRGELSIATDWQPYAEVIQDVLGRSAAFRKAGVSSLIRNRPHTKFERRGIRLGHRVFAQVYRKTR